jgi:5-methylcytosine-specific restriction endonuclease McrA
MLSPACRDCLERKRSGRPTGGEALRPALPIKGRGMTKHAIYCTMQSELLWSSKGVVSAGQAKQYDMSLSVDSIKTHLSKYSVHNKRRTTINHAFASALATAEDFSRERVAAAMVLLGLDPASLQCVYCDEPAGTWDHLHGLVRNQRYAGRGHEVGNLVPACKPCNSAKGSKDWRTFAESRNAPTERLKRIAEYESLLSEVCDQDRLEELYPDLMSAYAELRQSVNNLLKVADGIAAEIQRLERLRRSAQ